MSASLSNPNDDTTNPVGGVTENVTSPSRTGSGIIGGGASSSSSYSVLSEKVNRAIGIRTDTPAMKAALDALGALATTTTTTSGPQKSTSSAVDKGSSISSSSVVVFDSRNVRVAIEQDALQQALILQEALQSIVQTVQELHTNIATITSIAQQVRNASYQSIDAIQSSVPTTLDVGTISNGNPPQNEAELATTLMKAFQYRSKAYKRYTAINTFLDKFNLSERDNYLLENYNFDTIRSYDHDSNNTNENDGIAFLKALDRVRTIRKELQKQSFIMDNNSSDRNLGDDNDPASDNATNNNNDTAVRMMENLAEKQERAYERLYRWLQTYLRLIPGTTTTSNLDEEEDTEDYLFTILTTGGDSDDMIDDSARSNSNTGKKEKQPNFVQYALYTLRSVPAFYGHIVELIATSRRTDVTKRFLLALTVGDPSQHHSLPIELKSHDAVAYVGDMLAFCFKAFSVEADIAKKLLEYKPVSDENNDDKKDLDTSDRSGGNATDNPDKFDTDDEYYTTTTIERVMGPQEMLAISMSGIARPLKSRIMQVISNLSRRPAEGGVNANTGSGNNNDDDDDDDDDADDNDDDNGEECSRFRSKVCNLYDVCGLLLFYISVMNKSVEKLQQQQQQQSQPPNPSDDGINPLVKSLAECFQEATQSYEAIIRVYCAMLEQWAVLTGESESTLIHSLLVRIAEIRLSSPGFSADIINEGLMSSSTPSTPVASSEGGDTTSSTYRTILSIEWVTETLIGSSKCTTLDDVTQLKQSIVVAEKAGINIVTNEKLIQQITGKEQMLINELVSTESLHVLELCGLGSIKTAYEQWKDENTKGMARTMASYPGLSQSTVENAIQEFYTSLYSPPLPTLESSIKDPVIRRRARVQISATVTTLYTDLYTSIREPDSGYTDIGRFLEHPPDQVRTLFAA